MFGIGFSELVVVFLVALLVLGPSQLPTLARELAKGILRIRKYAEEFKKEVGMEDLSHLNSISFLNNFTGIEPHIQENNTQTKSELKDGGE